MLPFASSSYLAQVRRLRGLAENALTRFPIRGAKLHFLNHAENTTFRVEASGGKTYMLRIHRHGYHTEPAIQEELRWLQHINESSSLSAPDPILSREGKLLAEVSAPGVAEVSAPGVAEPRQCALFHWVEGRFIYKGVKEKHVFELGQLIARLHRSSRGRAVKHRRYWQAEGLLGTSQPTFGRVDNLQGVNPQHQKKISAARKEVFSYLQAFEKNFPQRQALIHADLHFGNFLQGKHGLGAIDFDDCGLGFHAYDLAIPLQTLSFLCEKSPRKRFLGLAEALQNGYASEASWDQQDVEALPYFLAARRILMLGWLQSRSEIPELKKRLVKTSARVAKFLGKEWRKLS